MMGSWRRFARPTARSAPSTTRMGGSTRPPHPARGSGENATMDDATRAYNTPDFSLRLPDATRLGDTLPARVGDAAPDFEAPILDGEVFRLSDARGQQHIVLMMGSITSPM